MSLAWQGGSLADEQIRDKEISVLVAMRLSSAKSPKSDEVETKSELTKKLLWNDLVVKNGVVYRNKVKFKTGDAKTREKGKKGDEIGQLLLKLPVETGSDGEN